MPRITPSGEFLFSPISLCTFHNWIDGMHFFFRSSRIVLLLAIIFWFPPFAGFAQNQYSTSSKKAAHAFNIALQEYQSRNYTVALDYIKQAVETDRDFVEAWFLMADIYAEMNNNQGIISTLNHVLEKKPDLFPAAWYNLGKAYFAEGGYQEAKNSFLRFLQYKAQNESLLQQAQFYLHSCDFALQAMKNPVPFVPVSLGDSINTQYDEYWPSLSVDEQILVYTVLLPVNVRIQGRQRSRQEDFYVSYFRNGSWSKGVDLGPPLNTLDNEGAQSLTPDGRTMYFTACNRPDGKGQCDIYVTYRQGAEWTEPENLGSPVNTSASEKQPSISPDGKTLYFASNRPGGKGGLDIWCSTRKEDGTWQNPVNLGDSINTPKDEQSPFIHADNSTLYFSSNGHIGMGGYDIYVTRRRMDSAWSTPVNLGYPINTWRDEIGLIVNASGNRAYFATNREAARGQDIYYFDLYPQARPIPVSYMKGVVTDAVTDMPVEATFELINLKTSLPVVMSKSDPASGSFLVALPPGFNYMLNVSKPGYLFYSDHFALTDTFTAAKPFLMKIALHPVKPGEKAVLKNIFFAWNSAELQPESFAELNKLLSFMRENPSVRIEVSGHTDNTGSPEYNLKLSLNRAKVVADYLIKNGMDPSRIVAKGYGEKQPVAQNDTEEGRALNRRTEFRILGK
ncbi:MAG TPA: OmpA family protein [Bacteroidales bacterium]|nr:OmpA family protein [Bacteroidales bacterium]